MYDYVASKIDWLGAGLAFEGTSVDRPRLATLADPVPTCALSDTTTDLLGRIGDEPLCIVVDDAGVVLGLVRTEALAVAGRHVADVMQEAPRTFRPHVSATEMAQQLDDAPQPWRLVTNLDGTLVGIAEPDRVRQAAQDSRAHAN